MRITKKSSIAIRTLMYCAVHRDHLVTKNEIADICGVSANHLAQVINQLAQYGFIETYRGRLGGISLAWPAHQITVGSVFRVMEGEALDRDCFADPDGSCTMRGVCRLRIALNDAVQAFFVNLDDITLDSLVCDNHPLFDFFNALQCNENG